MKLWHHGLDLGTIEHSHKDGLDDIIKMMAESNLVTAQFFCMGIKVATAHSRTEIAGVSVDPGYHIKDICFENGERDPENPGIVLDDLPVVGVITGVHHQENQLKGNRAVFLDLLHELGQKHGILAAGDTDGDPVTILNELIIPDGSGKGTPDGFPELFDQSPLDLSGPFGYGIFGNHAFQGKAEPGTVAAFNIYGLITEAGQDLDGLLALISGVTEYVDGTVCRNRVFYCLDGFRFKKAFLRTVFVQIFFHMDMDGSGKRSPAEIVLCADVQDRNIGTVEVFQFFDTDGMHKILRENRYRKVYFCLYHHKDSLFKSQLFFASAFS